MLILSTFLQVEHYVKDDDDREKLYSALAKYQQ